MKEVGSFEKVQGQRPLLVLIRLLTFQANAPVRADPVSDDLLFAQIPILADSKCSEYGYLFENDSMICAGIYQVTRVDQGGLSSTGLSVKHLLI